MKKVIFSVGIPGAGKTTVLKEFAAKYSYEYVSPDEIRQELYGNTLDQTKNTEVWQEAYIRLGKLLDGNATVVFDATFADPEYRREFVEFSREHGAEKIYALHVATPLEIAKERNAERDRNVPEHVLERMQDDLELDPPSPEEGIDMVFTLDEFQKLGRADELDRDGEVACKEFNSEVKNR